MMPISTDVIYSLHSPTAGYQKHPNLEDAMFRIVKLFLNQQKIN